MKSSIKVDYASIYESNLGEREPIVRVDVIQSDDPRDTLLNCIFKPGVVLAVQKREPVETVGGSKDVYIIYSKNRFSQVCDLLSPIFSALVFLTPNSEDMIMVTSNDEFYFSYNKDNKKRSKGLDRYSLNTMDDYTVIKMAVADFKEFANKKK